MLYTMIIFIHYYYIGRSENLKSQNIDDPEFYFYGSICKIYIVKINIIDN